MKLKKMISLTTALLMTATVAAGIAAPATAAVSNYGGNHTIALLGEDKNGKLKTYFDQNDLPVDASGNLASATDITLGVYIFNDPTTGGLDLPISFASIDEQWIADISVSPVTLKNGLAYGVQTSMSGDIVANEKYNNGGDPVLEPENYKESTRNGVKIFAAPNGKQAISPAMPDSERIYDNGDGITWPTAPQADTYLAEFTLSLKAGTPKGIYDIVFDESQGGAFITITDDANKSIKNSVSFEGFKLYIGESVPVPMTTPTLSIAPVTYTVTTADPNGDRTRKFIGSDGNEVSEVVKGDNGETVKFTKGYAVVTVPVTVKDAMSAIGLNANIKITGADADKVMLDSQPRYGLNPANKIVQINKDKDITAGAVALDENTQANPTTGADGTYPASIFFGDLFNNFKVADGGVIFNLNFLVALNGTQNEYNFNVELSNIEWMLAGNPAYFASVDGTGVLLPNGSGNRHFTPDVAGANAGQIKVVDDAVAPTVTTTTAPGVTTTTKPVTTTRRTGGGGNAATDNPETGDNGVAGVIATIAVLGLAGGAAFLAKRKNDNE